MVKDAEAHAEDDRKHKELVEARNQADTLAYSSEKALKDYGDKISDDDKKLIEEEIVKLEEAAKGDDAEAIQQGIEQLLHAAQAFAKAMYEQADSAGGGTFTSSEGEGEPEGAATAAGDDDIIDADFEVKD